MYQVKFTSGWEVLVVGKGEKGLCKCVKDHVTHHTGTYAECVAWLASRAVREVGEELALNDDKK